MKSYKFPEQKRNMSVPEELVQIQLESGEQLETQFLVGADGFKSLVRQELKLESIGVCLYKVPRYTTLISKID